MKKYLAMSIEKNNYCSVTKIKFIVMQNFDFTFGVYALVVWTCIFVLLEKKAYKMKNSEIVTARAIAGVFNFSIGGFLPLICAKVESAMHLEAVIASIVVTIAFKIVVNICAYGTKSFFTKQIDFTALAKKVTVAVCLGLFLGAPIKGFYTLFVH